MQRLATGRKRDGLDRPGRPRETSFVAATGSSLPPVSYEQWITEIVKVVETVGTGIMVIGGLGAFLAFLRDAATDT